MSNKLVIAKFGEKIIGINDFQEKIHKGNIICPFCFDLNKKLRLKYDKRGYFAAWPNEGGHICGRGCLQYFDADWEGRKLVEIASDEKGDMEVTIDIFSGFSSKINKPEKNIVLGSQNIEFEEKYKRYKRKKKVFRDVIRTVYQMKKIIESNDVQILSKIKIKYKTGEKEFVSIDELVRLPDELNHELIRKNRFVILKVESVLSIMKNGNAIKYINAYSTNGVEISVVYKPYSKENLFTGLKDNYVIAYGRLSKDKNRNKYYLDITNDFNIEKMDNDIAKLFFKGKVLKKFDKKKYLEECKSKNNYSIKPNIDKRTNVNTGKDNIVSTSLSYPEKNDINKRTTILEKNLTRDVTINNHIEKNTKNKSNKKSRLGIFKRISNFLGK